MERWHIKKDIFAERMNGPIRLTYDALADKASVSKGSISNAIKNGCSLPTIEAIGRRGFDMGDAWRTLLVDEDLRRLNAKAPKGVFPVDWKQLGDAAEDIGNKLFSELRINALLTFAGPSLIFAGLVMARSLVLKKIMRVPVYTAILVHPNTSLKDFPEFDPVPTERFTILVPRALVQNYPNRKKRIAIIDDAIKTGKTMDALRNYFIGLEQKPTRVEFACCVCHRSRTFLKENTPICRFVRDEVKFRMPWGDAFAFEECFTSK